MTLPIGLAIFIGGLAAGFLTGLLGVGGGVVMVPVMYQVFLHMHEPSKVAFTTAVATSLAVMIFSGAVAAYTYYKKGQLKPSLMLWAGVGTLLGASLGAHIMIATDDRVFRYRHPIPTDRRLEKHAMLVVCGRKWGLIVSATVFSGP